MVRSNMGALRAHERNEQTDVPTFLADYWRAETAITRMIGRHFLDNYTASKLLLERVIAKFEASPQPGDELFLKGLRERKKWGAILHLQGGHTRRGWKKGRAV
jgi:hypothetical protein